MIHHFEPTRYAYSFGSTAAELRVHSGDVIVATTVDAGNTCADGTELPPERRQAPVTSRWHESNPLVGPIYVEEAEEGDTLAVDIEEININRDWGFSRIIPYFGSLTGQLRGMRLLVNEMVPERRFRWELDLERNVALLRLAESRRREVEVPLHPFIGSIGVAPRFGRVETSLTPGEFGGNMDCIETRPGTTLYLPVFAKGAGLAFGDVHAAQGDGELCGVAIETTAEVRLRVRVIKGYSIEWPRLEDADYIMTAGSARPLIDAVRLAYCELLGWLESEFGFERWEGWQVISQVTTMRVGNVVDPFYTVVAKFPKRYLPDDGKRALTQG